MKVLYVLHSRTGSPGGHMFSLEHISSALSKKIDVSVIVLGKSPEVLSILPFYKGSFVLCKENIYLIRKFVKNINPDVVHCFDAESYLFFVNHCFGIYNKILFTKCGGPSPRFRFTYPYCRDIVLFSNENQKFLKDSIWFKNVNFYYLPNRVYPSIFTQEKVFNNNGFKIVQIIRFALRKEKVIFSTLNLLIRLIKEKLQVKLLLAGAIYDMSLYQRVIEFIEKNNLRNTVEIVTDSRVNRGSNLLLDADCVIATGRSLMEAVSFSKIVLTPVLNISFPILLKKTNFEILAEYNFSGRAILNINEDLAFNEIKELIMSKEYQLENVREIKILSEKYFEMTDKIVEQYILMYKSLKKSNSLVLFIRNIIPTLYSKLRSLFK